jgi:hypothetical protein
VLRRERVRCLKEDLRDLFPHQQEAGGGVRGSRNRKRAIEGVRG